jgi:hypothetical protein
MSPVLRRAVAVLLVAALAACGSDHSEKEGTELAAETAKGIVGLLPIPFLKKGGAPAAAPNAEAMALSAMETNRGPLILLPSRRRGSPPSSA